MTQAYFFGATSYHEIHHDHDLKALLRDRDRRGTPPILLAYLDYWHSEQLNHQTG